MTCLLLSLYIEDWMSMLMIFNDYVYQECNALGICVWKYIITYHKKKQHNFAYL